MIVGGRSPSSSWLVCVQRSVCAAVGGPRALREEGKRAGQDAGQPGGVHQAQEKGSPQRTKSFQVGPPPPPRGVPRLSLATDQAAPVGHVDWEAHHPTISGLRLDPLRGSAAQSAEPGSSTTPPQHPLPSTHCYLQVGRLFLYIVKMRNLPFGNTFTYTLAY